MKRAVKRLVTRALNKLGFEFQMTRHYRLTPWSEDPEFTALMTEVRGRTLVDPVRCYILYQYARATASLGGEVAEAGVYRGGTGRLLAKSVAPDRTVHLFDTFEGMPATDPSRDVHREGDFSDVNVEDVAAYLSDCPNVRLYPGLFPATAEPVSSLRFSLVHVDVDIYQSVKDCCEFFYPRLVPGGIMVFDDYGFLSCPGAKAAVDEFFSTRPETPLYLPTVQCVVTRYSDA